MIMDPITWFWWEKEGMILLNKLDRFKLDAKKFIASIG